MVDNKPLLLSSCSENMKTRLSGKKSNNENDEPHTPPRKKQRTSGGGYGRFSKKARVSAQTSSPVMRKALDNSNEDKRVLSPPLTFSPNGEHTPNHYHEVHPLCKQNSSTRVYCVNSPNKDQKALTTPPSLNQEEEKKIFLTVRLPAENLDAINKLLKPVNNNRNNSRFFKQSANKAAQDAGMRSAGLSKKDKTHEFNHLIAHRFYRKIAAAIVIECEAKNFELKKSAVKALVEQYFLAGSEHETQVNSWTEIICYYLSRMKENPKLQTSLIYTLSQTSVEKHNICLATDHHNSLMMFYENHADWAVKQGYVVEITVTAIIQGSSQVARELEYQIAYTREEETFKIKDNLNTSLRTHPPEKFNQFLQDCFAAAKEKYENNIRDTYDISSLTSIPEEKQSAPTEHLEIREFPPLNRSLNCF